MADEWILDHLLASLVEGQAVLDELIAAHRYRFGLQPPSSRSQLGPARCPELDIPMRAPVSAFHSLEARAAGGWPPGQLLRAVRQSLNVGPVEFLDAVGDMVGWIAPVERLAAWETAEMEPPVEVMVAASLLGPAELRPLLVRQFNAKLSAMDRRQFLVGFAGLVLGSECEPWDRLAFALARPSRVDQETVSQLERVTVALERLESQAEPAALLGAVDSHLNDLTALLGYSLRPSVRKQLCSLAGEAAGVAGRLRWILDDDTGAESYYQAGLQAAREAGDSGLGAYLMGKAACRPFYREDPSERLQRLSGTFGFRPSDATSTTKGWLAMLEAEAHALRKDAKSCSKALDRATTMLAKGGGDRPPRPRVTFFNDVWLMGQRGACMAKLGELDEAREDLNGALSVLDSAWAKQRTWLLVMLAGTYVDEVPEEACRLGSLALAGAVAVKAHADVGLVRGLRRDLQRCDTHPAVREFDEQIRATAG